MSVHENGLIDAWERLSENHDYHAAVVAHKHAWIERARAGTDPFDDAIAQFFRPISLAQFCAIAQIRAALFSGDISYCRIDLNAEPHPDSDLAYHQDILRSVCNIAVDDSHDIAIEGDICNGSGDSDGEIRLLSPVKFSVIGGAEERIKYPGPPTIPLEIGYTQASRTMLHLMHERSVARWPYGSTKLTILSIDNPKMFALNV